MKRWFWALSMLGWVALAFRVTPIVWAVDHGHAIATLGAYVIAFSDAARRYSALLLRPGDPT